MLRWQKPQSGTAGEMDEHNQPTEPMPQHPDPTLPTLPGPDAPVQPLILPAPQQQEQPFPQQYVGNALPPQGYQPQQYAGNALSPQYYPPQQYGGNVLPPQGYQPQYVVGVPPVPYAPGPLFGRKRGRKQRWQPGQGQPVAPIAAIPMQPDPALVSKRQRRAGRRSPIPGLVTLFFVFVQLILVASFVLKLVNPPQTNAWIDIINALGSLFMLPALALLQQIKLPFTVGLELYILPAIVLYNVFSRILVKILRLFL